MTMATWTPVAQAGDISPDTGTLRVALEGEAVLRLCTLPRGPRSLGFTCFVVHPLLWRS